MAMVCLVASGSSDDIKCRFFIIELTLDVECIAKVLYALSI